MAARRRKPNQGGLTREPRLGGSTARQSISSAAAHLFEQRGYAAATVSEIVAAAGTSKPSLYYYFGSKAGVYRDLVREREAGLAHVTERRNDGVRSASSRIITLCGDLVLHLQKDSLCRCFVTSMRFKPASASDPEPGPIFRARIEAAFRRIVADGQKSEELARGDADSAAEVLLGVVLLAGALAGPRHVGKGMRRGHLKMLDIVLEGLAAEKRPSQSVADGTSAKHEKCRDRLLLDRGRPREMAP